MSWIDRLFERLGYVKLWHYGMTVRDGRIVPAISMPRPPEMTPSQPVPPPRPAPLPPPPSWRPPMRRFAGGFDDAPTRIDPRIPGDWR